MIIFSQHIITFILNYYLVKILKTSLFFIIFLMILNSCNRKDDEIKFTFLQLNDVYEIAALGGGEFGGMDRVETLHKELLKENPNTFMFMAGDFLNPSLLGNVKYKGERIKGKQMIDVMNAMNFDLVTFGNHEFDLSEELLQERIDSSNFQWISTDVKHLLKDSTAVPFYKNTAKGKEDFPRTVILNLKDEDGTTIKIGFFSATVNSNPVPYVKYTDFYENAKNAYNNLKTKTDLVFGLTHLKISQDKLLAKMLPDVPLLMGGHEHYNMLVPVGNVKIAKADANARTVYVHRITYNKKTKEVEVNSELVEINPNIPSDRKVAEIVDRWQAILNKKIEEYSPKAYEVIYKAEVPLNGMDDAVRSEQTNLGKLIAESMAYGFDYRVDGALVNGGSMRLDDMLKGNITGVDVFRVMPFGGSVIKVKITGKLLKRVLNYGRISKGEGSYLQRYNFTYDKDKKIWYIKGKPIDDKKVYTVAFSDYLLKGYDISFLKPENK
ncbi:MAG: bifunctional metallophosphatase/5'-nucleotidase, partial [Flavobacteriia bacterium]